MNDVLNQDTLSSTIAALLKPSRCDALEQGSTGTYPSSGVQGGAVFVGIRCGRVCAARRRFWLRGYRKSLNGSASPIIDYFVSVAIQPVEEDLVELSPYRIAGLAVKLLRVCRHEHGRDQDSQALRHTRRDGLGPIQQCCGFAKPGCALLGQGSGFVFGVAGVQCRLLRQMQHFDRGRWPAMIILELDRQLTAAGVDVGTAGRPTLVQSGVDTEYLPDRPLRRIAARPFGKPHAQGLT